VAYQRLAYEAGLSVSPSSFRRYLRAHLDEVRPEEVVVWRPPVEPGSEAQVDYGYLGTWEEGGCHHRVWAFSMVLSYSRHLFVRPGAADGPGRLGGMQGAGHPVAPGSPSTTADLAQREGRCPG
jgi:hypothetical protein